MVPQTGARPGNGPFRQRLIGGWCNRSLHRVVDLLPMGLASRVRGAWMPRCSLPRRLAMGVLSTRAPLAHLGRRTADDRGRPGRLRIGLELAPALARLA